VKAILHTRQPLLTVIRALVRNSVYKHSMERSFTDCEDCTAYKCTGVSAATSSRKGIFVDRPCMSQMFTSIFLQTATTTILQVIMITEI